MSADMIVPANDRFRLHLNFSPSGMVAASSISLRRQNSTKADGDAGAENGRASAAPQA
jgi:hypothetical protein